MTQFIENRIQIPKYIYVNNNWEIEDYENYIVRYLTHSKNNRFRIVVNGKITKQTINIVDGTQGYKKQILSAISEFKNSDWSAYEKMQTTNKGITLDYLKSFYSKTIVKNINNYLLPINKEVSRDTLTEYNLY